jgi:predicted AlkP superfamily phosphohydrolase/phosphomutase
MGTPDMLGTYGTYQHFSEEGKDMSEGGGKRSKIVFNNDIATSVKLIGPKNTLLKKPKSCEIEFVVQRDREAKTAVIEIQGRTIILKEKEWSKWIPLSYELSTPAIMPDKEIKGICRFYVQEISPNFRLYTSPINADPSSPDIQITEPPEFSEMISQKLGRFYTTGFQEDHKALTNGIFTDDEFVEQAEYVLWERINLLNYAFENYDDGLLFFYFSSTDLQSHMLWWDSDAKHPLRSASDAKKYFNHLQDLYIKMDKLVGNLLKQHGDNAHIMIMSDHGFANFKRQFNLNTWLLENDYIGPPSAKAVLSDVDWSETRVFALGINGLYLNLKGREKYGIVQPGKESDDLLDELVSKLEAIRDTDGRRVISKVHRSDRIYSGSEMKYAPDLIVGYARDFRASWKNCLGDIEAEVLSDNGSAWSADHCMDSSEVPGVLFSNRPIAAPDPWLVDLAPSILTEFGLKIPSTMTGKNIFKI